MPERDKKPPEQTADDERANRTHDIGILVMHRSRWWPRLWPELLPIVLSLLAGFVFVALVETLS
jgi:hypothetical protein